MNQVLETTRHVTKRSQQVTIDKQALADFSKKLIKDGIEIPPWNYDYHFFDGGHKTVAYLLVLDSINFCFWPAPGEVKLEVQYKSETLSGYYALAACLKKALDSGVPITRAKYLAELSLDKFRQILGGKGELQLMEARAHILNELGAFLITKYNGEANRLVESAGNSALNLVGLLVENLPSFRDVAKYHGKKIYFYKRAQIFVADLYAAFGGKGWGYFKDIDYLTAFADYKLPQVLRHVGIFQYSPSMEHKVDQGIFLEAGSPEEIEIRANTIWAVELIRQELRRLGKDIRAFEIDWILWNLGQESQFKAKPYHRTVTIYY
ncbi:MAG: queuosine salvage family protein [Deltaproteobacteria bacterium]|nr:queuosine salvage family protein [Deltaproteobacteria bacterium]